MRPARLSLGFLVGVLSVLMFHQGIIAIIGALGLAPVRVYQWSPNPWGVPIILNQCFWGGLWGILFVWLWDRLPDRFPGWLFGVMFGVAGPALLGNWLVLPTLRGQPLFGGFVPARMTTTAVINGTYGLGLALLLPPLARFLRRMSLRA